MYMLLAPAMGCGKVMLSVVCVCQNGGGHTWSLDPTPSPGPWPIPSHNASLNREGEMRTVGFPLKSFLVTAGIRRMGKVFVSSHMEAGTPAKVGTPVKVGTPSPWAKVSAPPPARSAWRQGYPKVGTPSPFQSR